MSKLIDLTFGNIPLLLFFIMAVITVLAVVRTLIKMKKKRAINVTPVGVFNDLPESCDLLSCCSIGNYCFT